MLAVDTPPVGVLVADWQAIYRSAVVAAVDDLPGLELASEADDAPGALATLGDRGARLAVVAHDPPRLDALELMRRARGRGWEPAWLVVVARIAPGVIYRCMTAGALACVARDVAPEELRRALRAAAAGQAYLPDAAQASLVADLHLRDDDERPLLDARQLRILERVAAGDGSAAIGRELHLSEGSIKAELTRVYAKLGVSGRVPAVAAALRHGLID
jgi:DNA-binding NarL/FixJ family response regulator